MNCHFLFAVADGPRFSSGYLGWERFMAAVDPSAALDAQLAGVGQRWPPPTASPAIFFIIPRRSVRQERLIRNRSDSRGRFFQRGHLGPDFIEFTAHHDQIQFRWIRIHRVIPFQVVIRVVS